MAVIFFYNLFGLLLFPLWLLALLVRLANGKEDIKYIKERFIPKYHDTAGDIIWIHAASVGESNLAINFIEGLRQRNITDTRFVITCMTLAARKVIAKKLPRGCSIQLLPVDNLIFAEVFLRTYKPKFAIFIEAEFWPCIISRCARRCRMFLLNARMADKSFARWSKVSYIFGAIASKFSKVICQSGMDKKKFQSLGIKGVENFGNLKFLNKMLKVDAIKLAQLQKILDRRDVIVCASTHSSDEEILLPLIQDFKKEFKSAYFIIVPRHTSRKSELSGFFKSHNISFSFASEGALPRAKEDIFIVDKMGELGTYYKLCNIAFVGGSCASFGGHSPIEPAMFGKAVITGPDMRNFAEISEAMIQKNAIIRAKNPKELKTRMLNLLEDKVYKDNMGNGAYEFTKSQKAGLERYFDLVAHYLRLNKISE